ncbi:hypothetical protein E2C01_085058 [Portunus trituberculatus]|uniref:Uncharacterized protein n=1 Tax=Portunus trituberculatus TaxID=210409 RepID=A0A5B7IWY1_PORTR|nr:hypothetical protein [Portunus trituberculatus]
MVGKDMGSTTQHPKACGKRAKHSAVQGAYMTHRWAEVPGISGGEYRGGVMTSLLSLGSCGH